MKVFLSSTCYNLEDLRAELELYLISKRHKPLLSNRDTFPVEPGIHRHDVCLNAITDCDLFIIIIDSRYGANYYRDNSISITCAEYRKAVEQNIRTLVFVRESVFNERFTYKKNRNLVGFSPSFVDDIRVFALIDEIQQHPNGYWMQSFHDVTNVKKLLDSILKSQKIVRANNMKNKKALNTQHLISATNVVPLIPFSSSAKDFIKISGYDGKELNAEALSSIISLLPETSKTIGTLIDFEIDHFGIPDYTQAITLRPMDDDGSSWFCAEVSTALGKSVLGELKAAKSKLK